MTDEQIHRALSADGTEIAGRVQGDGPPLVMVHGAPHDGDLAGEQLVPHLADRFTCYLPSLRGRGLSGASPDHSPARLEEDVRAFVESIGEPVYLFGWSAGAAWAPAGAAHCAALALYEPTLLSRLGPDVSERRDAMYAAFGAALADHRFVEAVRIFHTFPCTDSELAALDAGYYERCAELVPAMLAAGQGASSYDGPLAIDPGALAQVTAPVLLLRGEETELETFYTDTVQYVAEHVADPQVHVLAGVGHFAPRLAPELVARELVEFFESVGR